MRADELERIDLGRRTAVPVDRFVPLRMRATVIVAHLLDILAIQFDKTRGRAQRIEQGVLAEGFKAHPLVRTLWHRKLDVVARVPEDIERRQRDAIRAR